MADWEVLSRIYHSVTGVMTPGAKFLEGRKILGGRTLLVVDPVVDVSLLVSNETDKQSIPDVGIVLNTLTLHEQE